MWERVLKTTNKFRLLTHKTTRRSHAAAEDIAIREEAAKQAQRYMESLPNLRLRMCLAQSAAFGVLIRKRGWMQYLPCDAGPTSSLSWSRNPWTCSRTAGAGASGGGTSCCPAGGSWPPVGSSYASSRYPTLKGNEGRMGGWWEERGKKLTWCKNAFSCKTVAKKCNKHSALNQF